MKRIVLALLIASLAFTLVGQAKDKKPKKQISALFENARCVYVEAFSGDSFSPRIFPEDREAIYNVTQAIMDWGRYTITVDRKNADLVFAVRKGRVAEAKIPVIVGNGGRVPGSQPSNPGDPFPNSPSGQETRGAGVETEIGSPDDTLAVYTLTPSGSISAPIWRRSFKDGLDHPGLELFKQIKQEIESAYPKP